MERIPILKMGDVLLVTIQIDVQDQIALALQDDLSTMIDRTGANAVLIDICALEIVDSSSAACLPVSPALRACSIETRPGASLEACGRFACG